jgi:putative DNA primase/helicase
LFRSVEKWTATLLIDEADSFLMGNDELRGVLNSGHRRDTAKVIRPAGDEHEPRVFSTWGAKAIAQIGKLPATLEDRAIVLQMKRKNPGEPVEWFRPERISAELEVLRRKISLKESESLLVVSRPASLPSLFMEFFRFRRMRVTNRGQDAWLLT